MPRFVRGFAPFVIGVAILWAIGSLTYNLLVQLCAVPVVFGCIAALSTHQKGYRVRATAAMWVLALSILGGLFGFLLGLWFVSNSDSEYAWWFPFFMTGPMGEFYGGFTGLAIGILRSFPSRME